jgi:hypothetical protein
MSDKRLFRARVAEEGPDSEHAVLTPVEGGSGFTLSGAKGEFKDGHVYRVSFSNASEEAAEAAVAAAVKEREKAEAEALKAAEAEARANAQAAAKKGKK